MSALSRPKAGLRFHVSLRQGTRCAFEDSKKGRPGRFECRLPDASASPYLVTAAWIAAELDGIDRLPEPSPACHDDLFERPGAELKTRGIGDLPQGLDKAIAAPEALARRLRRSGSR